MAVAGVASSRRPRGRPLRLVLAGIDGYSNKVLASLADRPDEEVLSSLLDMADWLVTLWPLGDPPVEVKVEPAAGPREKVGEDLAYSEARVTVVTRSGRRLEWLLVELPDGRVLAAPA